MPRRRLLAALVAVGLAAAPPAAAAPDQESTFQDDNRTVYASPAELRHTLDELRALGVDRIRVSVFWRLVAPAPRARERPAFDAADPAHYPPGAWDRYDAIVREAGARGLAVSFNLTSPVPRWAATDSPRRELQDTYAPSPEEFGRFARAVGTRYSGSYPTPLGPVPRVSHWSIWNEPNHAGWLTPQWVRDGSGRMVEHAPRLYRALADAAWSALVDTGHGSDTVLLGETAPKGFDRPELRDPRRESRSLKPLRFIRLLYCVDRRLRPLRGTAAARRGCPRAGDAGAFAARHPALFAVSGYAHHPYNLLASPDRRSRDPDYATIADLPRLARTLDPIFRRAGSRRRLPLHLTEYGYQTDPPDPFGVSWGRQASYLNQSEWLAYRNPRVRTLAQFLLVDDRPVQNFQTGLLASDGRRKPAYTAYRVPIWVPDRSIRRGRPLRLWALVRPAANGARTTVEIRFRRRGTRSWRVLARRTTANPRNYLWTRVRPPASGLVRVIHFQPDGHAIGSRSVRIGVHRARRGGARGG